MCSILTEEKAAERERPGVCAAGYGCGRFQRALEEIWDETLSISSLSLLVFYVYVGESNSQLKTPLGQKSLQILCLGAKRCRLVLISVFNTALERFFAQSVVWQMGETCLSKKVFG